MECTSYTTERINRIERYLTTILLQAHTDKNIPSSSLLNAMEHSILNGGKRLRPLLVYATGEALDTPLTSLDAAAAAVELIHCYSLVHDDLPAMDNDDWRRGKPACHKAFDEGTAILAGDALQTLAFQILADPALNPLLPKQALQMIYTLAKYSGCTGMVEGQALDIRSNLTNCVLSVEELRIMHRKKTGALIEASVTLGAIASIEHLALPANWDSILSLLQEFARCLGLAFQIQDDILDVTGNEAMLGKTLGKDKQQNKITFPNKIGLETAKQYALTLYQKALETLESLPLIKRREYLVDIVTWLETRTY